jgi:hypothetical protein
VDNGSAGIGGGVDDEIIGVDSEDDGGDSIGGKIDGNIPRGCVVWEEIGSGALVGAIPTIVAVDSGNKGAAIAIPDGKTEEVRVSACPDMEVVAVVTMACEDVIDAKFTAEVVRLSVCPDGLVITTVATAAGDNVTGDVFEMACPTGGSLLFFRIISLTTPPTTAPMMMRMIITRPAVCVRVNRKFLGHALPEAGF